MQGLLLAAMPALRAQVVPYPGDRPHTVTPTDCGELTLRLPCCAGCALQGQIRWAMAGRSRQRLEAVRLDLSKTYVEELKVCGCVFL